MKNGKIRNYLGRDFKRRKKADKLSKKRRSWLMSRIRSKNTDFEKQFMSVLRTKTNIKFITHVKSIKGTPDIIFEKQKICVFLDSDFWHGWQYARWKHLMKNSFWKEKIDNNRKRDRKTTLILRKSGWVVLRFWEHQIKREKEKVINKVISQF